VLFKEAKGETLTAEQMQTIIDRPDASKLRRRNGYGRARRGGLTGISSEKILPMF